MGLQASGQAMIHSGRGDEESRRSIIQPLRARPKSGQISIKE
jgi:hypothetical protein